MKAAVVTRYGAPEVLEVCAVPAPMPRDDEVLVRVHASTVCFGDRMIRQGPLLVRLMNGLRRPKISILGVDLAGTVVATGKSVTRFAPGDQVFGSRGDKFGAYAELACVSENGFLARKPVNMTMEEAASIFVGAVCSLYFLRKANIRPGERVLVHGASGSLGTFAVQLAKHYGAHVTGVCGAANEELVRSLGADDVIDYTRQDFTRDGPRYDVICDAGRALFMTGPATPVQADLEFLKTLIERGELRAVIGRTFTLDQIVEAHRHGDTGHKVGNLVVVIGGNASERRTACHL
jgi:NADPH:quinone reductase-like Zn-dependent oxidoreductase